MRFRNVVCTGWSQTDFKTFQLTKRVILERSIPRTHLHNPRQCGDGANRPIRGWGGGGVNCQIGPKMARNQLECNQVKCKHKTAEILWNYLEKRHFISIRLLPSIFPLIFSRIYYHYYYIFLSQFYYNICENGCDFSWQFFGDNKIYM